jgi:mannose-6-phosphate isomerase-like protein (cupin superfamily)
MTDDHEHHSVSHAASSPIAMVPAWDPQAARFAAELQGKDHGDPGLSVILVDAEPGQGPSLHCHDYAEIMIVLEGRATFTDGTDSVEVTAGHIAFVPAGTPHGFTNSGDGPLKQIDIHVANAFLTEWLD